MLTTYLALALLGLAAVDPIGIGIILILLIQKHPYKKVFSFLFGSFVSLLVLGFLFAKGFGRFFLRIENQNHWFIHLVEIIVGIVLLIIAFVTYIKIKQGKNSIEPSQNIHRRLRSGGFQLFVIGAIIVALQSLVDLVFVIAMIRVGQLKINNLSLILAVVIYSIFALLIQIIIVGIFKFSPNKQKAEVLSKIHRMSVRYSYQIVVIICVILSFTLFWLSWN